jgi:hypothetical protein
MAGAFVERLNDGGRTHLQYTRNIPHTPSMHGHSHNRLFDGWDAPLIHLGEPTWVSSTRRVLTENARFSIRGLAVRDHLSLLAGRTRHRRQHQQRPASVCQTGITMKMPWIKAGSLRGKGGPVEAACGK